MDAAEREAPGVARDTVVGSPHAAAAAHWVGEAVPEESVDFVRAWGRLSAPTAHLTRSCKTCASAYRKRSPTP
jgi:hypothetical protein